MKVVKTSPLTGKKNTLDIDFTIKQYNDWKNGMLIQDAMPNLSSNEREFLMTGLTPDDWEIIIEEEEEGWANL